jgi:hypothetical protein
MLLRHATPARNLDSIRRRGLLTAMSRGALPLIWLHAPGASLWAVPHVSRRHGVPAEAVVVLTVNVPRSWLRRNRRGLWTCDRDIPPARIVVALSHEETAAA